MTTWQATRQKPRQHPLDELAQAQVELDTDSKRALYQNLWQLYSSEPESGGKPDAPPDERDLWLGVLICMATAGVTLWGIWRAVKWVMQ